MNKYDIEITETAEIDLYEIGRYIANELLELELANKVISTIGNAILNLEEMPYRNSLVRDERLSKQGIRRILIENYIVFYVINEEGKLVTIVRILYNRRDWEHIL